MIKDYFNLAFNNLKYRRLRTWLTMLGIFIGVAAIVSLISLGQGLEKVITEQFEQIGVDTLTIIGKAGPVVSPIASSISTKPLTKKDVEIIEDTKGVDYAVSLFMQPGQAVFKDETKNLFLYGMNPEKTKELFTHLASYQIKEGRDLKGTDKYKLVIGYDVANIIFDKKVKLRDTLEINNQDFKVVGILEKIGSPPDDQSIYMHIDIMRELFNEPDIVSMIFVKLDKGTIPDKVADNIKEELLDYRNEEEGSETFVISTAQELLEVVGNILGVVTAILVGIAAISLLVGGIGIMNTMYTAVLERTREIGIMKAIGAKNSDILLIFLIESGLLGLVGGLIGILIGFGLSKGVELIAAYYLGAVLLKASFSPLIIIGTLSFSFIIGSISGTLPAIQASKLKPVDALRHE